MDSTEEAIAEFFTEFPDTRMGVFYDNDEQLFVILQSEQSVGSGKSVEQAIFDAKKNLAIKKVKTLSGFVHRVDPDHSNTELIAIALKRAAVFTSDEEMTELVKEIRRNPWKK
jgi:hypothetical protein